MIPVQRIKEYFRIDQGSKMVRCFCRVLGIYTVLTLGIYTSCEKEPNARLSTIRGHITENNQGVSGIKLHLNGSPATTTNADGTYLIDKLPPGDYVVEPVKEERSFDPAQISLTIKEADVSDLDFVLRSLGQLSLIHKNEAWDYFNPGIYSIKQNTPSLLQLDLEQNGLWYQNAQGGLLYQTITGNFSLTATVNAVQKTDNQKPVACDICLGGIMVRNPVSSNGENYIHLVTGNTPNGLGYEYKSTVNGVSDFTAVSDGSAKHQLRIQRTGNSFILSQKKVSDTEWTTIQTLIRNDLPASIMVGLNIYTAQTGPVANLSIIYEDILLQK